MKFPFAVLLLKLRDNDTEPFDRAYAERLFTGAGRGTRNLVDYYLDMSHGQADLSDSQVFDWRPYGHSASDRDTFWTGKKTEKKDELAKANQSLPVNKQLSDAEIDVRSSVHANLTTRAQIKLWAREALGDDRKKLDAFHGIICVFNGSLDYFGLNKEVVVNFNPANAEFFSVDLTGLAHEVGHGLGLEHSALEHSEGEYEDAWDVMSAYSVFYNHAGSLNPDPSRPYNTYGPGLNAVNMRNAGWLDQSRVFEGATSAGLVRLRPLHHRELPGHLAALIGGYWFEFRMNEFWDSAIPEPCVLVHQTGWRGGAPCSELVIANKGPAGPRADLRQGEVFERGSNFDIFSPYLRVQVARLDPVAREVDLDFALRAARPPLGAGAEILFGVTNDAGGLVFVPGRGLVKVPPRSPLLRIIEQLAEVEALQAMTPTPDSKASLDAALLGRLEQVQARVGRIIEARTAPKVPASRTLGGSG